MAPDNQLYYLNMVDKNQTPIDRSLTTTQPDEDELCLQQSNDSDKSNQLPQSHDTALQDGQPGMHCRDDSLSRIFRCTPVPTIILDKSLHVIEVSDSYLTFSKQSRDSLLGACIYDVSSRTIPASHIPTFSGAVRVAITTQEVQVIENIHLPEMNSYYSLRMTPIFEGSALMNIILEAHNITNNHTESMQQAYVNETYKILVDTVRDYSIVMLDPRGNIATWNSGAAIIKGYSADRIIGEHFSLFYSHEDRLADKPGKELQVCLQNGKVEDEGWRYRHNGSRFWANTMMTPIYESGRHVGFVRVTRDLTERKAAEARMIAAFEESSKMKSDFLANISHEIRTPMNGMVLALTMLTGTELNTQQREYTSIIEDSTTVLLQIINDVLDYSKLSSGSFSLNADVLSVESIVKAVTRNCKPSLKPDVKLSYWMASDFPKLTRGDPLRYRQVVQNLVGNAVKFTEKGYVQVKNSFSIDEVDPGLYNITTEVIDSGIGVSEDAINTLFTPFTRFADSPGKQYQGTGLGLSICKGLAELMDGTIGFRPNPEGQGSIFWVTAKMGRVELDRPGKPVRSLTNEDFNDPSEQIRNIAPQKHILLVEDNIVNQVVMLKLLQNLGFERVDAAWDGAEAVRLVKQTPLSYSAILMDINMPVMDGVEATAQIRSINTEVPIFALTGNALKGDEEQYLAKGMNDYIAKPIHRKQLVQLLWKWLAPG